MVLGRWQGRESKVNIDVKFEDVVRCDLPLARYSIARKVHCTSELFSMLTAHVPTAFGMISSNVLATLRYRRHGWSTQAYYAQSHGDNTPQSPAGPPHHSPPLIRASRITEYAISHQARYLFVKRYRASFGRQTPSTAATYPIAAITTLLTTRTRVGLFVFDAGNITP
jgi:hypothetical protein